MKTIKGYISKGLFDKPNGGRFYYEFKSIADCGWRLISEFWKWVKDGDEDSYDEVVIIRVSDYQELIKGQSK